MTIHDREGRSALIAYGSETGNAHDYAEEIERTLERIRFDTHLTKLDAIDPVCSFFALRIILYLAYKYQSHFKAYSIVIIIVSTAGQGELPTNARLFWKSLLRKKLPLDYLDNTEFTTFGLGDRSYPKFNWAARKLHKRLVQLGAVELYPRGEADEQHSEGLDATFVPWCSDLRQYLLRRFPLPEDVHPIPEDTPLPPRWLLAVDDFATSGSIDVPQRIDGDQYILQNNSRSLAKLDDYGDQRMVTTCEENRRLTPKDHWQDVRHLVLSSKSTAAYRPGDTLIIYPENDPHCVAEIISQMGWEPVADKPIKFVPSELRTRLSASQPPLSVSPGTGTTLRHLLTRHLDITAIPRRSFFSLISHFTNDQFHKDRLIEFSQPQYIDELYDYTTRPRRSILEVLQEFDSVKIPWQWAANVLPELRGRQFSIASGGFGKIGTDGSARFELLVAIVKYRTVIKKIREGVCTRYLAGLKPDEQIFVSLQKGGLGITEKDFVQPSIMIGPGTGVAPMRSLIWERSQKYEESKARSLVNSNSHKHVIDSVGESLLFFGCRNKLSDFFYADEWKAFEESLDLHVYPAFSRDQTVKVYVQDLIRSHSKEVFRVLHELHGTVYVCGSSGKMPSAVRAALADVVKRHGELDEAASTTYMENLEREGRYKQETW